MKNCYLLLLLLLPVAGCGQKKEIFNDYTASIKDFQTKLNAEFSDAKTSPLTKKDFKRFKTLDFFPIDSVYKVIGKFIRTPNEVPFKMTTTTSRESIEVKYGEVHFTLHNTSYKLNIYQNQKLKLEEEYKNYLFLPFTDLTNSNGSYGGGRYIDLEIPEGDTIVIDFNTSYNPYCAYNHTYSCPIPPKENSLEVSIKAGVKDFGKH